VGLVDQITRRQNQIGSGGQFVQVFDGRVQGGHGVDLAFKQAAVCAQVKV